MTVLVTADLHWSDNPRDDYRHRFVDWLVATCRKEDASALFILGDLTEQKDEHRAWLVNTVVDHISRLARTCPVVLVRGNHDFLNPDWPFFRFVERINGVTWINDPISSDEWHIRYSERDPAFPRPPPLKDLASFLILPHTTNPDRDWDGRMYRAGMPKGVDNHYSWIFTHNTFEGASYGRGDAAKGISLDWFDKQDRVISGDIHVPQKLGPVTYVGAPYLVDFGDDYEPRILALGRAAKAIESITCPGPQKRLVEITSLRQLSTIKANVEKGDIVKVRVSLTMAEHARWPEIQERVREWGDKAGVRVHAITPQMVRGDDRTKATRQARAKRDDTALVREYVKQRGVDNATEKTGIRLLSNG